uniref:uncharacterized protein LOC131110095 isoform X2 n=1 Tax=Doryrhamphus excisus TaxID=161450 RepID=UPI0025ADE5A8|nr:uncharacterized protein LOC131110095 isoform X2 [Doryrhamphus excisus]
MDVSEDQMTPEEMLDKPSELVHSDLHVRLVDETRGLAEAAEPPSERQTPRNQVKAAEGVVTDGLQGRARSHGSNLGRDVDGKERKTEDEIQELERESMAMKELNEELVSEVERLREQSKQDKMSLSRFSVAIRALELCAAEAQMGLQQRDEMIEQKLQLKQAEETVEEYSNIIKDLRLTKQELTRRLEDREDEASLDTLNDPMGGKEASHLPGVSLADELKLLASTGEMQGLLVPCQDSHHEETQTKESRSPPVKTQTIQCTRAKTSTTLKALVILLVLIITILLIAAAGNLPVNNLWRRVHLALQPYCSMHYGALPPI